MDHAKLHHLTGNYPCVPVLMGSGARTSSIKDARVLRRTAHHEHDAMMGEQMMQAIMRPLDIPRRRSLCPAGSEVTWCTCSV